MPNRWITCDYCNMALLANDGDEVPHECIPYDKNEMRRLKEGTI